MKWRLDRSLQCFEKIKGVIRCHETGHILDTDAVGAHCLKLFGLGNIIVQSIEDDTQGIISTLKKLGLNIKKMEKGTLWILKGTNKAEEITQKLLYNKHYQKYSI